MIDLSTSYLGLRLSSPLVVGAGPLCESLEQIEEMEANGASAVVLHSLFEEQMERDSLDLSSCLDLGSESHGEALAYLPDTYAYDHGPQGYLDYIEQAKRSVGIPIIASLNGSTPGGWLDFARQIEGAGADALELNIYFLPTDPNETSQHVEDRYAEIVSRVLAAVTIPVAIKLGPFFTSPLAMAQRLDRLGIKGLVLFNRFYQADFDLETLDVVPHLALSRPSELLLRIHWAALMHGYIKADMAITGGVHAAPQVLKCLMAGAKVAMMTSALLEHGVGYLRTVKADLVRWMEDHEYDSLRQMSGSLSRLNVADPEVFERANYMKVLRHHSLRARSRMIG